MKIINRPDLTLKFNKRDVPHTFPIAFCKEHLAGIYVPYKKWTRYNKCSCVFACPKFKTYAMDRDGVRIIPADATCPYVAGPCMGNHWYQQDCTVRGGGFYVAHKDTRNRVSPVSLGGWKQR